jgi:hypothetical protein
MGKHMDRVARELNVMVTAESGAIAIELTAVTLGPQGQTERIRREFSPFSCRMLTDALLEAVSEMHVTKVVEQHGVIQDIDEDDGA